MSKTILIMAGGTGGHIFPALAVAQKMRDAKWRVVWLGHPSGMEARLVPSHGFEMVWLHFSALRGKGFFRKLSLPFRLLRALWQSYGLLRQVRPDVVLGMGGYITFPCGLMASFLKIPLVVHEQNAVAGLANKSLAKRAARIATGFPGVFEKGLWLGNPVRAEIAALPEPALRLAGRTGALHLLVLGGSLGATALNEMLPQGIALLAGDPACPQIVHQTGEAGLAAVRENYENAEIQAYCVPFIEDMAGAYEWADVVICRAGALTIAEISAAGVASILVPYPHAVDDHQRANAEFLVKAGAATLIDQAKLTPEIIAGIAEMSRETLFEMAEKARGLAKIDAADELATLCAEAAK